MPPAATHPPADLPAATTPSPQLIETLAAELATHPPFAQMASAHVGRFVAASTLTYHAPGELVLSPADGPVDRLIVIRRGAVTGRQGLAAATGGFAYEAGDLFPVGALMAGRAVTSTYTAEEDTFCLQVPSDDVRRLAAESAPFADFLSRRVLTLLEQSQRAFAAAWTSRMLAEQSLEAPLGQVARVGERLPLAVAPHTPLGVALAAMHERRVGSVVVTDGAQRPVGILTRHDVLSRVTLAQRPLDMPIEGCMTAPVATLPAQRSAFDAALLMSRRGIRHVPLTDGERLVGIVSERDLFALQRLSLKQVGRQLREAPDAASLQAAAPEIRRYARHLLSQGVGARQLTALVSHLNDVLTERLVQLLADEHGVDLQAACWLAFGSEGRSEQTIATDQDNGLVFVSDHPERDRPRWLAFGRAVNLALQACGYPLCPGQVMAGNPLCCLATDEWQARLAGWIEHGAPNDLLQASIFFDLRPLAGRLELAAPLRSTITARARGTPRFLRQLAENGLRQQVPLNWRGALQTRSDGGGDWLDVKLNGTAILVDAARLYALAHGVEATGTRDRLVAVAGAIGLDSREGDSWVGAFEYLQRLRLQVQVQQGDNGVDVAPAGNPNAVDVASLSDLDRHTLKETLRVARRLQQRIELDYLR